MAGRATRVLKNPHNLSRRRRRRRRWLQRISNKRRQLRTTIKYKRTTARSSSSISTSTRVIALVGERLTGWGRPGAEGHLCRHLLDRCDRFLVG